MKISNSPAALLAASAISLAGCKADKEPAKTLVGQLRELAKSNLEGVDGVKRNEYDGYSKMVFDIPDDRNRGRMFVGVENDPSVISDGGGGFYICKDANGDGVWEKMVPHLVCSRDVQPADAYFDLKDKELRPVKWQEMQELCNKRARLVLKHYRSSAK